MTLSRRSSELNIAECTIRRVLELEIRELVIQVLQGPS